MCVYFKRDSRAIFRNLFAILIPFFFFFYFLFQYEYFNAVLINERDKDGNFLELGKEFILAPNDHFNNLPVNISLSDVQVPTNMYNKGKTYCCWSFKRVMRGGCEGQGWLVWDSVLF